MQWNQCADYAKSLDAAFAKPFIDEAALSVPVHDQHSTLSKSFLNRQFYSLHMWLQLIFESITHSPIQISEMPSERLNTLSFHLFNQNPDLRRHNFRIKPEELIRRRTR